MLLEAAHFDWSGISPAIFGSLFQAVMLPAERHEVGGHYTTEENILKALQPLLLDELAAKFEKCRTVNDPRALSKAHDTLDRAVDVAYRPQPFPSDLSRVSFIFNRYAEVSGLMATQLG